MKPGDFEHLLRVNTLGTAYVTWALLPGMKSAGGGRILFTSSLAGQVWLRAHLSLYCELFQALLKSVACPRNAREEFLVIAHAATPLLVRSAFCRIARPCGYRSLQRSVRRRRTKLVI